MVKLFNNNETGNIYLKLRNESKGCFGPVKSKTAPSQKCSSSSSCCPTTSKKTFYDGTCFNWEPDYFYSETGLALASLSGYYWYNQGSCPCIWWSCIQIGDKCYDKTIHWWKNWDLNVCGNNGWIIPNSDDIIWQIGLAYGPSGTLKTIYVPSYDGTRCKLVLQSEGVSNGWGSVRYIKIFSSTSHVTNLYCSS